MINAANVTWLLFTMRRFLRRPATTAVLTVIALLTLPMLPVAAQSLVDPSSNIEALAQSFFPTAQAWAFRLYMILLGFELFAFAVQAIIFKDNVGEFIGGVALKILVGGVFLWFAANASSFFFTVINGFRGAGQLAGGSNDATPFALVATGLVAGAAFLVSSDVAHASDAAYASSAGNACTSPGVCLIGTSQILATGHNLFELVAQGLGLMIMLAFTAIFIQVILTTIESYIVIFAGVFYIGFAGSRFTMPYSQGYFSYVINVGTKLFMIYFIAGALQSFILPLIVSAGTALAAACCIPGGVGVGVGLAAASYGAFESVIAASLVWGIPGFAASFLSGSSSASATAVMGQVAGSMTGAAMMMNGARGASGMRGNAADGQAMVAQTAGSPAAAAPPITATGDTSAKSNMNVFQAPNGEKAGQSIGSERAGLDQNEIAGKSTFREGGWESASREKAVTESRVESAGLTGGNGANGRATLDQNSVAGDANIQEGSWNSEPANTSVPAMQMVNGQMQPIPGLSAGGGNGVAIPSGNHLPLAAQMREMANSPDGMRQLEAGIQKSEWGKLQTEQQNVIENNPELRAFAANEAQNRMKGNSREMDSDNYMMLQGLAMAMPRDNAQPTATQIRIGNPDR